MTVEEITREALALPESQRAGLADQLIESLESATNPGLVAVLDRRIKEIDEGSVQPVPGKEALAMIRRKYAHDL